MCCSTDRGSLILGPKDTPVTLKLRKNDGSGEMYMVTALRHVLIDEWVRSEKDIQVRPRPQAPKPEKKHKSRYHGCS